MNPTSPSRRSFAVRIGSLLAGLGLAKGATVAVAGVPGHSLLEINCIAAVTKK